MATNWQSDGRGILPGGSCGGDFQSTDAFNVRYVLSGQTQPPYALVTVSFYGEDCRGGHMVTRQAEYLTCTDLRDPGSTEQWANARYETADNTRYGTAAEAARRAREFADQHRASDIRWNGEPWH